MDPLSVGGGGADWGEKAYKQPKLEDPYGECGSLLQQKRKVGRSGSGPTAPVPSFQLFGVHCRVQGSCLASGIGVQCYSLYMV